MPTESYRWGDWKKPGAHEETAELELYAYGKEP